MNKATVAEEKAMREFEHEMYAVVMKFLKNPHVRPGQKLHMLGRYF